MAQVGQAISQRALAKFRTLLRDMKDVDRKTGIAYHQGYVIGRFIPTTTGTPRFISSGQTVQKVNKCVAHWITSIDEYNALYVSRGQRGVLGLMGDLGFKVSTDKDANTIMRAVDEENRQIEFYQVIEE